MTDAEKIALYTVLLQVLRSTGEIGRPAERLVTDLRMAAFDITLPALEVELRALADKSWIAAMPQQLGTPRYRITARGLSILEEQGL